MAIRIIDPVPHKSVVKEHICTHCGARLEYTPTDVIHHVIRDYRGDSDTLYTIQCPQCNDSQPVRLY